MEELQREIDGMEEEGVGEKRGLDGMKFMKLGREKEIQETKREVKKLAKLL